MAMSFQDSYELCQSLASDQDATNLALFKKLYNIGLHRLEKKLGIYHTEEKTTFTTVDDAISGSSYQDYMIPNDFSALTELYVTVGSTKYNADLIQDDELWRRMNSTSSTSDSLTNCFIRRDRVELWPIPSSANTATLRYTAISKDLSATDYTAGTITTLANEGTAVTGSGSTWTALMVGRGFKTDDGEWYRIGAFTDATHITLEAPYKGTAIATGTSSYTIGEMARIPPDTHELPCWYALWKYHQGLRENRMQAKDYEKDWKVGVQEAIADWANRSSSGIIKDRRGMRRGRVINPNDYPQDMS